EATYRGSGVSAERVAILADRSGFEVTGVSFTASLQTLKALPFGDQLTRLLDGLPDWLPLDQLRARFGFDGRYQGGKLRVSSPHFSVVRAGLALFGQSDWFDLEQGKAGLTLSKHGSFTPSAQVPLYPGVGLEIGGLLSYRVAAGG